MATPAPFAGRGETKLTAATWVPLGLVATLFVGVVGAAVKVTEFATEVRNSLVSISMQIEEVKRQAASPKDRYTCSDHIRFVRQLKALNPRLTLADPETDCSMRDIP